jgi:hypothetical protein
MLNIPTAEDILAANGFTPFKTTDGGAAPTLKAQKAAPQPRPRRRTTKKAGIKVSKRNSRRR